MSVDEDWQEQLANSKIGREGRLWLLVKDCLEREFWNPLRAQRRIAGAVQNDLVLIRELCGDDLRQLIERKAYERARQVCKDRSGDALKRDEEQGHRRRADDGQTSVAPSSPAKPYVHPSLSRHTENGNGGADHHQRANQGQSLCARPAATANAERVRTDSERGHMDCANQGRLAPVPSPSVSMLGHNQPPKSAKPAIDPKRFMQAQQANKAQLAEAISDVWKLSDGKQVCKLPFYELKRRDQDGIASRTLREAAQKKYANLDETRSPQDLLSENELKECFERVKQLRIAEAA